MCTSISIYSPLRLILPVFAVLPLLSCGDGALQATNQKQQAAPVEKVVTQKKVLVPAAKTGVVKSVQNAAGYSYLEVDINGQIFWMATSTTALKAGEKIVWNSYAMMENFTSKALDRIFPQIMFVDKVLLASAVAVSQYSGRVVKIMDSGGYRYIQVETGGKIIWLAASVAQVAVGQAISWTAGAAMKNFSSRSLDRTFKEIFFVSGVQLNNI